jgi:hypothetical protein
MLNRPFFCLSPLPAIASVVLSMGLITPAQVAPKASTGTPQDVLTYHGDNLRTGWFSSETVLNTSNVNAQSFGLLQTVLLDGRVDAEPLVALQQTIDNQGVHDVVYVATENDSVYALDAVDGSVLWKRSLGTPAPAFPYKNDNNVFPIVGILSTPVIDRTAGAMYLVADVYNGSIDAFKLHSISLSNGNDLVKPVTIAFSAKLTDGTTWTFSSQYHLQRAALLEAGGNIYVGIATNGDDNPDVTRGALVAYDAATLKKIGSGLTNKLGDNASNYFLSSIWMSGYGIAADQTGDVYLSTGNSNPAQPTYDKGANYPESVLRVAGKLTGLKSSFTPSNYFQLDEADDDVSSGGVLLLPDQPGKFPHLAVAGGKDGRAFLLDRDYLGGYTPNGPDKVIQTVSMGYCWCGPAYFVGADEIPRVVTGGGNGVTSWKLQTAPSTQLVFDSTTGPNPVNGLPDNGGAFPVISSNGTTPGSAVVWFVQRPATTTDQDPGTPITLQAFAGSDLSQQLISIQAGTWIHSYNSNANIVPTVANGKVYVASNEQMQIFGLFSSLANAKFAVRKPLTPSQPAVVTCPREVAPLSAVDDTGPGEHRFRGKVCKVTGNQLQIALSGERSISVDMAAAFSQHRPFLLTPGRPIRIRVTIDEKGLAHAREISRWKGLPPLTP